ncbi:MAG: DUF3850 domain-containing protein [Chitinophagia bacterium]|nr:DUF3850 domain-containing protein [Chitinophagia bacterium]
MAHIKIVDKKDFHNLEDGTINWVIVKYDKSIKLGDNIRLVEYDGDKPMNVELIRKIIHIYRGQELKDDFAILTLKKL